MLIRGFGRNASLGGAVQESKLEKIGLDHIHDGILLLTDGGSNCVQSYWSATIFLDNGLEHSPVNIIQAKRIHLQQVKSFFGDFRCDFAVCTDLGKIANPA